MCVVVQRDPSCGSHRQSWTFESACTTSNPAVAICGRSVWMPPNRLAPRRSPTTDGWSRRCRPRGQRSPRRPCPSTIPTLEFSAPTTFGLALDAAVRAGYDTDTVAAIAGGLLGAAYGASAVPGRWRSLLHGWPGITAHDLVALATAIERKGKPDGFDFAYPGSPIDTFARHPYDDGVLLGGIGVLRRLPEEVDAVVSLCRVADKDVPDGMPHVEVRLIDRPERDENPHLDFVLLDTVGVIERFRREGRTVLVHCVGAYSRTPTMGALYGARLRASAATTRFVTSSPRSPAPTPIVRSGKRCGASGQRLRAATRRGRTRCHSYGTECSIRAC